MASKKDQEKQTLSVSFTVDPEGPTGSAMPSVTKLLNRRALRLGANQSAADSADKNTSGMTEAEQKRRRQGFAEPDIESTKTLTNLFNRKATPPPAPPPPPTATVVPAIRRAARRGSGQLQAWDRAKIDSGREPVSQTIALLLREGASGVLFLAVQPAHADTVAPQFLAFAAIGRPDLLSLWNGLSWDPIRYPKLWNSLVREGFSVLSPSSEPDLAAMRAALGAGSRDHLILLRVGSPAFCRGILSVITSHPNLAELPKLAQALSAVSNRQAA